jgi:IS4 transposase
MQQEDDQKCEKMKDEINGHCQEVGSSYSRGRDLVYIFNEFQDGACSREDTQVVDKERLEKFFRSALDASRRYKKLAFFTSYGLGLQGYPDLS